VATCDAVKRTNPDEPATGVMTPVEEFIVATFVLLDEYTIGAELLLVGSVVGENGASVFCFIDGTTNDDVESVFCEFTMMVREPANN
jgi:hypothetical protein